MGLCKKWGCPVRDVSGSGENAREARQIRMASGGGVHKTPSILSRGLLLFRGYIVFWWFGWVGIRGSAGSNSGTPSQSEHRAREHPPKHPATVGTKAASSTEKRKKRNRTSPPPPVTTTTNNSNDDNSDDKHLKQRRQQRTQEEIPHPSVPQRPCQRPTKNAGPLTVGEHKTRRSRPCCRCAIAPSPAAALSGKSSSTAAPAPSRRRPASVRTRTRVVHSTRRTKTQTRPRVGVPVDSVQDGKETAAVCTTAPVGTGARVVTKSSDIRG